MFSAPVTGAGALVVFLACATASTAGKTIATDRAAAIPNVKPFFKTFWPPSDSAMILAQSRKL
jgi:hypothetical protein